MALQVARRVDTPTTNVSFDLPLPCPMRTRDKWRNSSRSRTLEDNATALAYVCWQIALDRAKNLHREDFDYSADEQRTDVIAEYLCFLVHACDRLVHGRIDETARGKFVGTLAHGVARHYQRNLEDVFGRERDYRSSFVERLNQRSAEYAACSFSGTEPGFSMLRGLGRHVQDVMGEGQTNRWVIDQVMELDAPEAMLELKKSMDNLFGTADALHGFDAPD